MNTSTPAPLATTRSIPVIDPFKTVDPFANSAAFETHSSMIDRNPFTDEPIPSASKPSTVKSPSRKSTAPKLRVQPSDNNHRASTIAPKVSDNISQYRAIFNYEALRSDELNLMAGDVITVRSIFNIFHMMLNISIVRSIRTSLNQMNSGYLERI